MDLATFIMRFDEAAAKCLQFTRQIVTEELPSELRFDIPWKRVDSNGMIQFLGGRLLRPEEMTVRGYVETRKILWVDGMIPEWINFSILRHTPEYTVIEALVCNRLTDDDDRLYHKAEGYPPFHVLSPPLPEGWDSPETSPKFSLYWKRKPE
jgi:hypothetical protein